MTLDLTAAEITFNDGDIEELFVLIVDAMLSQMQEEVGLPLEELGVLLQIGMGNSSDELGFDTAGLDLADIMVSMMSEEFQTEIHMARPEHIVLNYYLDDNDLQITDQSDGEVKHFRRDGTGEDLIGLWTTNGSNNFDLYNVEYTDQVEFHQDGKLVRRTITRGSLTTLLETDMFLIAGDGVFGEVEDRINEDEFANDSDPNLENQDQGNSEFWDSESLTLLRTLDFSSPGDNDPALVGLWALRYYDEYLDEDFEDRLELNGDGPAVYYSISESSAYEDHGTWTTKAGILALRWDEGDDDPWFLRFEIATDRLELEDEYETISFNRVVSSAIRAVSWGTLKRDLFNSPAVIATDQNPATTGKRFHSPQRRDARR